jgi:hypothetical protein
MFLKFFDDEAAAVRFADAVPAGCWSPAQVQERLLKAGSVDEAIESFRAHAAEESVIQQLRAA